MIWTDSNGNYLVSGKSELLPDDMTFTIEDGKLVTEGSSYDLIDANGIIREHYSEPIPYALDDDEGVVVHLVSGKRFCE